MLSVILLIKWFVLVLWCDAFVVVVLFDELGEGWLTSNKLKPPAIYSLAVPWLLFCFVSLVILDVVCRYLS